jgi:hypothetical protein
LLVLLQHLQTLQMILPCILLFLVPSSSSAISLPQLLLSAAATRLLIVIILPLGNSTTLGTAVQRLPAHQIFNITTTSSNLLLLLLAHLLSSWILKPAFYHRYWTTCTTKLQLLL